MANNREIKSVDPVYHIKNRPNLYLGSTSYQEYDAWVLDENDKITYSKVKYTEALIKICNETIDNSFDEYTKTDGKHSTKIEIEMTRNSFSITDNGRGIPTEKNDKGVYQAYAACCIPMSGSNFEDDETSTARGKNGIGLKGTSIFSKKFTCITCDGNAKLKITAEDNLSKTKVTKLTTSSKTGTSIYFEPDFEVFDVKEFDDYAFTLIKTRLKFLSWFFPNCEIKFNGKKITMKSKELSTLFSDSAVVLNENNVYCCVYPSDEPYMLTYVNGLSMKEGGSHVDYFTSKIVNDIRDKIGKKYKSIKPADIKNRFSIVLLFNNFVNCKFDSQTKEKLTNSVADISTYLSNNKIDLDKFTSKIVKSKEIIDNITEMYRLKEELAEKKELAKLTKTKKEVDSEKYVPPIGKSEKKYLMITEGFSAYGGISPILGRNGIGYYMLKGKVLNVFGVSPTTFLKNQEIKELVDILGIDISNPDTDMNYEKVVILTDADADGGAIAGLVINLFSRIAPKMLKDGRICRMETPLLIGSKKEKIEEYYFSIPDKSEMKKGLEYFYLKGLGSWNKSTLSQIIDKVGGMDKLIKPYETDDETEETIKKWFDKDAEPRKEALRGRQFSIEGV